VKWVVQGGGHWCGGGEAHSVNRPRVRLSLALHLCVIREARPEAQRHSTVSPLPSNLNIMAFETLASTSTVITILLGAAVLPVAATIRPPHSWDTLSGMSFFHACNESGPFSERALDTITKFPMVTIEKVSLIELASAAAWPQRCAHAVQALRRSPGCCWPLLQSGH
jgi:hypothetical protein